MCCYYFVLHACIVSLSLNDVLIKLQEDFAEKSKATFEKNEADREFWQEICKNFLKGQQPSLLV